MIPRATRGSRKGGRRRARRWERQSADDLRRRWGRPELELFSTIDSTNEFAREWARDGAPDGALVLADEQTAGRGRGERRWVSPKGAGLYFSLVLRPPGVAAPALLPVLAGLAVVRALDRTVRGAGFALKWPNDVIAQDRKCGGVLAEAVWDGSRLDHVVLGVGLNVHTERKNLPKALRDGVISVDEAAGERTSRLELMDTILPELDRVVREPRDAIDPELLRDLDAYDWLRDRRCALEEPGKERATDGVAVGIAPDGALLFRPDGGPLRRIVAGHVRVPGLDLPEY